MPASPGGEKDHDLFVSYAHTDDADGCVAGLVETIRREHAHLTLRRLGVFFDRDAIHSMDDWEHRILAGLKASKVMLAVLSPAYFGSPFCPRRSARLDLGTGADPSGSPDAVRSLARLPADPPSPPPGIAPRGAGGRPIGPPMMIAPQEIAEVRRLLAAFGSRHSPSAVRLNSAGRAALAEGSAGVVGLRRAYRARGAIFGDDHQVTGSSMQWLEENDPEFEGK